MKPGHALEAIHWLGLQPGNPPPGWNEGLEHDEAMEVYWGGFRAVRGIEPDGCLHHGRRGQLVLRHTSPDPTNFRHLTDAIARLYPPHRKTPLLYLLRPHRLDDAFWRMIYALIGQSGPKVRRGELVGMIIRLSDPDEAAARAEAVQLMRRVFSAHDRTERAARAPAAEASDA